MTDQTSLTRARAFHDPAYPSPENLSTEQAALIADLNRMMASGKIDLEAGACLCGAADFELVARYDRYRIAQPTVICRACGLVQLSPRMTDQALAWFYGSDHYRALYNPEFLELTKTRFESSLNHARAAFLNEALAERRIESVLEVGCAAGQNLYDFHLAGKRVRGYDLGPAALAFGQTLGMDLRPGSYAEIEDGPYDLIILSHVMEHFNEPIQAVAAMAEHLSEGGVFYVEVPDNDAFCLGSLQNAHVNYFTEATLTDALARAALEPIAINRCTPHIGMLCQAAAAPARPTLGGEYRRMAQLIRRHDRREQLKEGLDRLGLLALARKILGRR
jgi:SAM-dependent methyltransferase